MAVSGARAVVDEHLESLRNIFRGKGGDPTETFHDDFRFIVTGQLPVSGTVDLEFMRSKIMGSVGSVPQSPIYGHYPVEYIEEGNRVVVICRGHLEGPQGMHYNNTFFMLFEIKDGKIVRFFEDMDHSEFMFVNADRHLVPA